MIVVKGILVVDGNERKSTAAAKWIGQHAPDSSLSSQKSVVVGGQGGKRTDHTGGTAASGRAAAGTKAAARPATLAPPPATANGDRSITSGSVLRYTPLPGAFLRRPGSRTAPPPSTPSSLRSL